MKRFVSLVLSLALTLALAVPAFAAEGELERVVRVAKERLSIPASFTEFSSEKRTQGDENIYELNWEDGEDGDWQNTINVTALADGEITSYYLFENDRDYSKKGFAAFHEDEYKSRAKEWLLKANPSYAKELSNEIDVNIGGVSSSRVSVSFSREIDGIPVMDEGVYMSLDKYTGKVQSMTSNMSRVKKLEKPEELLGVEKAGAILGEEASLSLEYKLLPDENRAALVYVPKEPNVMIDAKTGKRFEVSRADKDSYAEYGEPMMEDASAKNAASGVSLSPAEIENIEQMDSLLTESELTRRVKSLAGTVAATLDVKSVSYNRIGNKKDGYKYEANLSLTDGNGGDYKGASVCFDAETGELKYLNTYLPYEKNKGKVKTREAMERTARRFVDAYAPEEAKSAELFDGASGTDGRIVFCRSENGIKYDNNSVCVTIDEATGKILAFSKYWDNETTFDDPEGVIENATATEKYVECAKPALSYIANGIEISGAYKAEELRLIYTFSDSETVYIDAKTGNGLGWDMGHGKENKTDALIQDDLRGHFAETAVRELAKNGVVLSRDEKFRPNEAIKQKEIALLVDCFHGGYLPDRITEEDYKASLDSLIRRDIIKASEKKPEAYVPREEVVTYLVRLFDYGKAAELSGIFKTGFSDEAQIAPSRVGSVAIAKAIGLVSGNGKSFAPKRNVTRGELAVMLYNALRK